MAGGAPSCGFSPKHVVATRRQRKRAVAEPSHRKINQAALRELLRPPRELCTFRLLLEARAVVFFARAVVLRLLRPELVERERADAVRPRLELREDFADMVRLRPLLRPEALRLEVLRLRAEALRLRPAVLRLRAEVRDLPLVRVPPERELFARGERERVPELRRAVVERPRA